MLDLVVANRYAQALFELAHRAGRDEQIEAELVDFSAALKKTPQLEKFLLSPKLRADERKKIFLKLYSQTNGDQDILLGFFDTLYKKNRFRLIHDIAVLFKKIADESQGQATAEIRSAAPLDGAEERAITAGLEKMAGKKISARTVVDASLIGGVSVRIGNKILDGSVRHKLDSIKKELTQIGKN